MTITILDGGMGQELLARSAAQATGLSAAQILLHDPDLVRTVMRIIWPQARTSSPPTAISCTATA